MTPRLGGELFEFEARTVPAVVSWRVIAAEPYICKEVGPNVSVTVTGLNGQTVVTASGASMPDGMATMIVSSDDIVDENDAPISTTIDFPVDSANLIEFPNQLNGVYHDHSGTGEILRELTVEVFVTNGGGVYQDKYPVYVAAVESYGAQYTADVNSAYANYSASAGNLDTTIRSQLNSAYSVYQSAANVAFNDYLGKHQLAYGKLTQAIEDANAAHNADITAAGTLFSSANDVAFSDFDCLFTSAQSDFQAAFDTATNQFQAATLNATSSEDVAGPAALYESAVDQAGSQYSAAVDSALGQLQSAWDNVGTTFDSALSAAESKWQSALQLAVNEYDLAEGLAWGQYKSTEAGAWSQYDFYFQDLTSYRLSQLDALWNQFLQDESTAADAFSSSESGAWDDYVLSLAEGQEAKSRLSSPPSVGPFAPLALPDAPTISDQLAKETPNDPNGQWDNFTEKDQRRLDLQREIAATTETITRLKKQIDVLEGREKALLEVARQSLAQAQADRKAVDLAFITVTQIDFALHNNTPNTEAERTKLKQDALKAAVDLDIAIALKKRSIETSAQHWVMHGYTSIELYFKYQDLSYYETHLLSLQNQMNA